MRAAGENRVQPSAKYGICDHLLRNGGVRCGKPFVNRLHHQRNHQHDLRLEYTHIFHHMQERIVDAYGGAKRKSLQPVHHQTERVMDREHAQQHAARFRGILHRLHILRQIFLRQHDALTLSGRSGGKNNRRDSLRIRSVGVRRTVRANCF